MANEKIHEYLNEKTIPSTGDFMDIDADEGGGSYESKKITYGNLKTAIVLASPNIYKSNGTLTGDREVNLDNNFLRFKSGSTMFGGAGNSALSAVSLSKKNTGLNEYLRAWDDSNSSFWQIGADQRFTYRTASGGFMAFGDETNGGSQLNGKWLSLHGDVALRAEKTFNFGNSNQITNDSNFMGVGLDVLQFKNANSNLAYFNFADIPNSSSIVATRPDSDAVLTEQNTTFVMDTTRWNGVSSERKQSLISSDYSSVFNEFSQIITFSDDYGLTTETITPFLVFPSSTLPDQETTVALAFRNGAQTEQRKIEVGAVNSAGAGYRQLRILN